MTIPINWENKFNELEGKYINREAELFLIIKKTRKYKKMWKELYEIASEFNFFPLMDKIKQKYFPKPVKKIITIKMDAGDKKALLAHFSKCFNVDIRGD